MRDFWWSPTHNTLIHFGPTPEDYFEFGFFWSRKHPDERQEGESWFRRKIRINLWRLA